MGSGKQDLMNAINDSFRDLHQGLASHHRFIASLLDKNLDEKDLVHLRLFSVERSREVRLKQAIHEAIEVLEESRKAFKSKKLEALRKMLTRQLIDVEQTAATRRNKISSGGAQP
jgi:hypothetical protein